ncbi:MAG: glycosyltransferase [Candidatus Nomurabacteria bacterium]|nr:glycosyltransferase [Candidatus Nomurabacteria bacterium]
MIPKVIHYCWFGPEKPQEVLDCIESWKSTNLGYEIKEWNELNFPIEEHPFASRMYNQKKWAFVADYVRLYILEREGGFYLDADMTLLQSLDSLSLNECVLGEEEPGIISAGMVGAIPHHPFIKACKNLYDSHQGDLITIPLMLTQAFKDYPDKDKLVVLPPKAFYPYNQDNIKLYRGQDLGPDVYGVHMWHHSWGSPLYKFLKKIGILKFGKKVTGALGIKKILKKLLGFV